jgi:hypothetical protein
MAQVTALRRACARLDLAYRPKLTVVGVQHHHHTRFFAESPQVRQRPSTTGAVQDHGMEHHPEPTEIYLQFYIFPVP